MYVCIYLFHKSKPNISMFKKGRDSSTHSGIYGSDAAEILYNYNQMMQENISLTPEDLSENDMSDNNN